MIFERPNIPESKIDDHCDFPKALIMDLNYQGAFILSSFIPSTIWHDLGEGMWLRFEFSQDSIHICVQYETV